jgi:hypothetical protein
MGHFAAAASNAIKLRPVLAAVIAFTALAPAQTAGAAGLANPADNTDRRPICFPWDPLCGIWP